MACSAAGSSVHGIYQARILKWAAIPTPGDLPEILTHLIIITLTAVLKKHNIVNQLYDKNFAPIEIIKKHKNQKSTQQNHTNAMK